MRFTVAWHPSAERELADIWLRATDRARVAQSANTIDQLLASSPLEQGRIFTAIVFLSSWLLPSHTPSNESDRRVHILQVWH
jgi:hypothetical protein